MTLITGNTYPVKDAIKALGGKWDADRKGWQVPDAKAAEARKLVSGGSSQEPTSYRPRKCIVCGVTPHYDRRGYPDVRIYRSGECQDCYEERKMGY